MEITFKGKLLSESLIDEYQTRWKIHQKKIKGALIIFGGFTIAFGFAGLVSIGNYSMVDLIENRVYFNLNLFFSIALSSLLVFLYFLLATSKRKKHLLSSGSSKAKKHADLQEMTVDFGDDFIQLDKKLTVVKLNWTLFSQIFYIDQFIFIAFSNDPSDSICLDTSMISAAELDQIKTFLNQKIKSS